MTVQLYENCWGVTQSREKRGPIGLTTDDGLRNSHPFCDPDRFTYREDGSYGMKVGVSSPNDIIAVFATEAEADAYLAGETAEAPKFPEVGSSFDFIRQDGTWIKVRVAPDAPAPKPVTWPDGAGTIELFGGDTVTVAGGYVVINHGLLSLKSAKARQLAALLLAAADHVEGRG